LLVTKELEEELATKNHEHASIIKLVKELENNILSQHPEGFHRALRQTSLLFNGALINMSTMEP